MQVHEHELGSAVSEGMRSTSKRLRLRRTGQENGRGSCTRSALVGCMRESVMMPLSTAPMGGRIGNVGHVVVEGIGRCVFGGKRRGEPSPFVDAMRALGILIDLLEEDEVGIEGGEFVFDAGEFARTPSCETVRHHRRHP